MQDYGLGFRDLRAGASTIWGALRIHLSSTYAQSDNTGGTSQYPYSMGLLYAVLGLQCLYLALSVGMGLDRD